MWNRLELIWVEGFFLFISLLDENHAASGRGTPILDFFKIIKAETIVDKLIIYYPK